MTAPSPLIPVEEARDRLLAALQPVGTEEIPVRAGLGRVLAQPVTARLTQPPAAVSAMDGWAVRHADLAVGAVLRQVGYVPAGQGFEGRVGPGETVRVFTGAPIPDGADTVVIQEDADQAGSQVTVRAAPARGRHIRRAGLDFSVGDLGLDDGRRLTVRDLALAAAMNHPWLVVRRRPRVAILATGDEVVRPGDPVGPNQIVSANAIALAALVEAAGGEATLLGIAPDDEAALGGYLDSARGHDLLVTTGGASVGAHDLVQPGLARRGLVVDFWKIGMRPGKPLMFGQVDRMPVLGLPGNPVSTLVCGLLFLRPAVDRLQGLPAAAPATEAMPLAVDMAANDSRQDYVRARFVDRGADGRAIEPMPIQDSSMISVLAHCDGLIVRPPRAPAAPAGSPVPVLRLDSGAV